MVDLSTARAGCEVQFRCGGKAVIAEHIGSGCHVSLVFKDYSAGATYSYFATGNYKAVRPHPLDIVSITDPPLTDAERLVEIARRLRLVGFPGDHRLNSEIPGSEQVRLGWGWIQNLLALAEGRAP